MEVWSIIFLVVVVLVVGFVLGFFTGGLVVENFTKQEAAYNGVGEWYVDWKTYKVCWRWKKPN